VRSCPSPKKSREIDFVIETLIELNKNRKQNPRAGPPNRVPYGQKPRNGKETARPARRQPTKFNGSGARVAVQEDECSVCSDDESSQSDYAGSILPAPARWVAHAASARATASGAGTRNLSFTGASAGELFSDEDGETDAEGAADAFTVHHAYAAPAADAREPAIDIPIAPTAKPEPAEPHDGWLDAHDGPNAQWAAEEWQAEIKANSISTKCDDKPEIDGYADLAQDGYDDAYYGDARAALPYETCADFALRAADGPEPEEIDVMAAFAQCGIDDVGPWPDIPVREFRLPRPEPEGTDFAARQAARAGILPDSDFAEPDPIETHK